MVLLMRKIVLKQRSLRYFSVSSSQLNDFSKTVEEFRENGVAILPLKIDDEFVKTSKKKCLYAWEDALNRGKTIKGYDIKVGQEHGFKEIVHRATGRYDMQWKIDGEKHFLDEERVMNKFLPFVYQVLGGETMTNMNFNGCLFSVPGAKEQLWHIDGEHLFTSEDNLELTGKKNVDFFSKAEGGQVSSILPAHCLNIFIPLVDVESNNGGTEFCLGSHFNTKFFKDDIIWQNSEWKERIGFKGDVMAIKVNAGEVLAFDYRVLHRALDHQGSEVRPVLYYTFTKRWFSDAMNFAELPSLKMADGKLLEDKVERWRTQYPQLAHNPGTIYCDGAAGSQIPERVITGMTDHLVRYGATNIGANYKTSEAVTSLLGEARVAGKDLLGPDPGVEIMFGYNCSNLMFHLSSALANSSVLGPGDNVLLSPACHDANVASWMWMARNSGAQTRWLPLREKDRLSECDMLDVDMLETLIDDNTKVISLALASNVTGRLHLEALRKIVEISKSLKKKPFIILDATHFTPHQVCDLTSLGADAVVNSAYKYFGPHLGVMAYNRERFSGLQPSKVGVRFDSEGRLTEDLLYPGDSPTWDNCQISRWENGTPNYEGLAGFVATVDYLASLSEGSVAGDRRGAVVKSYTDIANHEAAISKKFLSGIQPLLDQEKVFSRSKFLLNICILFS